MQAAGVVFHAVGSVDEGGHAAGADARRGLGGKLAVVSVFNHEREDEVVVVHDAAQLVGEVALEFATEGSRDALHGAYAQQVVVELLAGHALIEIGRASCRERV